MGSAHPMPNTERQCAAMAAFQGSYFFQSDILEAFSQWPLAQGSGVAACIGINGKILQPMVAPMGRFGCASHVQSSHLFAFLDPHRRFSGHDVLRRYHRCCAH
jgi:hypothetical protein